MAPPPVDNATSTYAPRSSKREAGDRANNHSALSACNLIGKQAIVVGAGVSGTAKVEMLLQTGARVTVVDPTPSRRVTALAEQGRVRLKRRKIAPTDVVRATLVVAATGRSATNKRIGRWAKPLGAVVNVVEDNHIADVSNGPFRGLVLTGLGRHGRGQTDVRPRFTCL